MNLKNAPFTILFLVVVIRMKSKSDYDVVLKVSVKLALLILFDFASVHDFISWRSLDLNVCFVFLCLIVEFFDFL